MTYKIALELTKLGVKISGGYITNFEMFVDTTQIINVRLIRQSLAKMIKLREAEPDRWEASLTLMATLQLMLDLAFNDNDEDNAKEFPISKGFSGISNELAHITITIIELTVLEIHEGE